MDRAAHSSFDIRDIHPAATRCDDDRAEMKQRYGGPRFDPEDRLLAARQAIFAIEHEVTAPRPEQDAARDPPAADHARPLRSEPRAACARTGAAPARPCGRAG